MTSKYMKEIEKRVWLILEYLCIIVEKIFFKLNSDKKQNNKNYPPVFIIGAPRSGTTLLYQLLVYGYNFGYFTNFMAKLCRASILATWLVRKSFTKEKMTDFSSHHGETKNWSGPNEAGDFWYRWFPKGRDVYVAPDSTTHSKRIKYSQTVKKMANIAERSFVFKNTFNSMRVAGILEAMPEACVLVCYRKPEYVAQSILKSRIDRYQDKNRWWSLPPKEIDEIQKHPYWEQVVEQVYYTYSQIEKDEDFFGSAPFLHVQYEDLCQNTSRVLGEIEEFLRNRGVNAVRNKVIFPEQFTISTKKQVSDEDYNLILKKVNELW